MEQDLGVSLTGTQEQANVIFGGVTDYVWFPWGIPGRPESGFGQSIRRELLPPSEYEEVESRMAIFHSGLTRASADTNLVWMKALSTEQGYRLHRRKLEVAYEFAEALRLKNWGDVLTAIREYRELRTALCPDYMNGAGEILGFAERKGCTAFPLGAGGGGAILVYGPDPHDVEAVRLDLQAAYREIPFRIMAKGHDLMNLPLEE
jgi:D-glycero-alpha-D-manno-heptose-7-phosphate kinase